MKFAHIKLGLLYLGGETIKLKMGKGEGAPAKEDTDEEKVESETGEEKTQDAPAEEVKEEKPADEIVKDVDSIRKVIKVNQPEEKKEGEENIPEEEKKEEETPEPPAEPPKEEDDGLGDLGDIAGDAGDASSGGETSREGLEQKRAILQNIKDFDFQIKKNQEDIGGITQKMDGLSKDLDDLVSLYEIVSEQMNPFVGLSKVTKKRLDALESFTREIDLLKERTGELESFAERSGAKFKSIAEGEVHAKTIDTDAILGGKEDEQTVDAAEVSGEVPTEEVPQPTAETEITLDEVAPVEASKEEAVVEKVEEETIIEPPATSEEILVVEEETQVSTEAIEDVKEDVKETSTDEIEEEYTVEETYDEFADVDLDKIIEMSMGSLSLDNRLDMFIDEFIESLKG